MRQTRSRALGNVRVYIMTDLLSILAALGATYAAAELWHHCASPRTERHMTAMAFSKASTVRPLTDDEAQVDLLEDDAAHGCGHDIFELSFQINGQAVDPDALEHALGRSVLATIRRSVSRRAGALRCPTHGSAAKLIVSGSSLGSLSWEAPGCCPALVALIKRKLATGL